MKNFVSYLSLLLVVFVSCKNEKELKGKPTAMTIGALTISTDQPQAGETIDITYKNPSDVEGFYYYMVGVNNYPVDIDLKSENGEQKSSIKIPDSAIALAFIFKSDDTYDDNNNKGYLIPLYNADGVQVSGSNSAMAYYGTSYGADYGIKKENKEVLAVLKADLAANTELKTDWESPYLNLAYKENKEEGRRLIDAHIVSLSNKANKSEKEYMAMMNFYAMTNQQEKSDSIKMMTLEKFPKGNTARFAMYQNYQRETDLEKKAAIFQNYKDANPNLDRLGKYIASDVANGYLQEKDMDNFEKYSVMFDNKAEKAYLLNNRAWNLVEKGENLEDAEKMSKMSLEFVEALQKNPEEKPEFYSHKQYKKQLESSYRMYADTYALIMFKQGNVKDAITYQEKAFNQKSQDADANARYIEFLIADKQFDKASGKAEEFIEQGHSNDKLKKEYKVAYLKTNPISKDFEEKLKALEAKAEKNAMAEIKKAMLDEEAPTFTLKDTNGDMVSLESLKGKTVILDFWATWCGPCKASFPGMQQVVTKYKNDDNVKLLFVDTFESGKDREKNVVDFIKKNKYDFHVVYDSDDSTIAEKYGVTGIPTKVVIGPDGKMKFKSVGFSGSADKLVSEMDMMIAALKP